MAESKANFTESLAAIDGQGATPPGDEVLHSGLLPHGLIPIPDGIIIASFLIHLVLCALISYLLYRIYRRWGFSLSNRSDFGRNFVLLSCCTMLVVTIVKSSLSLSLGLVGALSIVRFRAAIKEPEELSFLFLSIGIGLGFGAEAAVITIIAFAFIAFILWLRKFSMEKQPAGDYHMLVTSTAPTEIGLDKIRAVLLKGSQGAALKRLDQSKDILEASFQVQFSGAYQLDSCHQELLHLGDAVSISLMDNRGVGN